MEKVSGLKTGMPMPESAPKQTPTQSSELKESPKTPKTEEGIFEEAKKSFIGSRTEEEGKRKEKLKFQGKNEKEIEKILNIEKERDVKKWKAGYDAAKGGTEKKGEGQQKDKYKAKKEEKPKEKVDDKKEAEITKEKLYADIGKWREELVGREAAYKEAKKKGIKGESILEMSFEEAKKSYEKAKTDYASFIYKRKLSLLKGEKGRPEYEQELCELKGSLFRDVIIREQDELAKAKYNNLEPRKRTWFRGLLENYIKAPMWKRVAISTAMVTGTIATGGLVGGLFGLSMGFASGATALGYGVQRFVRGVIGGATGGYAAGWVKRYFGKKVEKDRMREIDALQNNFGLRIESVKTDNEFKDLMLELNNGYEQVVKETNKRHRNITLWASGAAFAAGLGSISAMTHTGIDGPLADLLNSKLGLIAPSSIGVGGGIASVFESKPSSGSGVAALEQKPPTTGFDYIPPENLGGVKAGIEHLQIGNRGPEGSIIDYFRGHSDVAKQFGWDGKTDLSKWAGVEAHKLWLEQAKSALINSETISKMKVAGFPLTEEGYADMMTKIGKGTVSLDITHGKIGLENMEYLKFKAPLYVPGELVEPSARVPGELVEPSPAEVNELNTPRVSSELVEPSARVSSELVEPSAVEGDSLLTLSSEKQDFLDKLIYQSAGTTTDTKVDILIEQIKQEKLTLEDFGNYYANRFGGGKVSNEMMSNLRENFKIINEGPGTLNGQKYLAAKGALTVILQRLQK